MQERQASDLISHVAAAVAMLGRIADALEVRNRLLADGQAGVDKLLKQLGIVDPIPLGRPGAQTQAERQREGLLEAGRLTYQAAIACREHGVPHYVESLAEIAAGLLRGAGVKVGP